MLGQGIDEIKGTLAPVEKMGDDHVVRIAVRVVEQNVLEQAEVVVIDKKINRYVQPQRIGEGVVDQFLVSAEFIEQEKNLELPVNFGVADIVAFALSRLDDFFSLSRS